jgi:hypothetical protein
MFDEVLSLTLPLLLPIELGLFFELSLEVFEFYLSCD